jgi:WD40 repeat protein
MSYCLNPNCPRSQNPPQAKICQSCNTPLLLKNRYRAIKLIGQGNFGRTLLAVDETSAQKSRCVAKQFFPHELNPSNQEKAARLFQQEAAHLAQLGGHPQIPNLLDYVEQGDYPYVVQEYIEGANLAQELATQGLFSESRLRKLLQELLPVLDFMHQHQVIHRDIKPENIIARPAGALVLVDFGAAKIVTGTSLAKTGTLIGSASYAAPEQAAGKALFASDLYSLGVTCVHLFTGVSPFDLYDLSEGRWAWQDYATQPMSPGLVQILNRMVEPATKRRYSSAMEILGDLKHGWSGDRATPPAPRPLSKEPLQQNHSAQPNRSAAFPNHPSVTATPANHQSTTAERPPVAVPAAKTQPVAWECWQTLESHTRAVHAVAWNPTQEMVASGSEDGTIKLWLPVKGELLRTLSERNLGACDAVAFSSDGQILASSGYEGDIRLWTACSGRAVGVLKGHRNFVSDLAFSADGQWLASTSYDNTLRLWNMGFSQRLFLWHIVNAKPTQILTNIHQGWVSAVAFSPDSQLVATVGEDGTVQLRRIPEGKVDKVLTGHQGMAHAVAFSTNGQWIASSGRDKTIRIWQVSTGQLLHTLTSKSEAHALCFCDRDRILVSGHSDCNLHLWQVSDGRKQGILTGHTNSIYGLSSHPNSDYFVSGSEDRSLKIWQLRSGRGR